MSETALPPTRLEAAKASEEATTQLRSAWTGVEITDGRIGITLAPNADARLSLRLVGYPPLTGLREACTLLDTESRYYRPRDITLEGDHLVCLMRSTRAPALRQGFTLALEPEMARMLGGWLPRLCRVAELGALLAAKVAAVMGLKASLHPHLCVELVARLLLDRQPHDMALTAIAGDHGTAVTDLWQSVLTVPGLHRFLEQIEQEATGAPPSTLGEIVRTSPQTQRSDAPT